jgi:hypothetical protein
VLNDTRLFCERERVIACRLGIVRHSRRKRKIRAGVERRIDVDQVHFAGKLRQQRWQHVFLVAPDQPVAPFLLAKSRAELKALLAVLRRLVDRFDGLERQRYAQRRACLAPPPPAMIRL